MKTRLLAIMSMFLFLCLATPSSAVTLENIVTPFPIPSHESYTANDWSLTEKIKGIKWSHKGLRETPRGAFVRSGKVKLDSLGQAEVFYSGARTMVTEVEVSLPKPIEESEFSSILKSQFSKLSNIISLRGACKDEGLSNSSAVYQITLQKKKPIYLLLERSAGASGMEGITTFQFALEPDTGWKCKD